MSGFEWKSCLVLFCSHKIKETIGLEQRHILKCKIMWRAVVVHGVDK